MLMPMPWYDEVMLSSCDWISLELTNSSSDGLPELEDPLKLSLLRSLLVSSAPFCNASSRLFRSLLLDPSELPLLELSPLDLLSPCVWLVDVLGFASALLSFLPPMTPVANSTTTTMTAMTATTPAVMPAMSGPRLFFFGGSCWYGLP